MYAGDMAKGQYPARWRAVRGPVVFNNILGPATRKLVLLNRRLARSIRLQTG